jgi:hypothetical protein
MLFYFCFCIKILYCLGFDSVSMGLEKFFDESRFLFSPDSILNKLVYCYKYEHSYVQE